MRLSFLKIIVALLLLLSNFYTIAQDKGSIEIYSSNPELVQTFNWAKEKALSFVQTGKTGPVNISERKRTASDSAKYIPSYWAGYPLRTAFYSRDFCHQIVGAHLLGLEEENYAMLNAFASSANESRKWYPLWAINFDGSPYNLDYQNDDNFVREVPAVFELVEKTYQLYLWTGDENYLINDTIWNYCKKAVTDFVKLHDTAFHNGVAEGTGKGIFQGASTYNEQRDIPLIEAGDGIASQYKAFHAFAKMALIRGEKELADKFLIKSFDLYGYFNSEWGLKNTAFYNRGYSLSLEPVDGWGKENSWFIPMKGISNNNSERHWNYLQFIDEKLESKEDIPDNIEAISYIPEVFFVNHKNETGWKWMKYIISELNKEHIQKNLTGSNGNYPEVSFVLISNTIENLLGISPHAARNKTSTLSHLPDEIDFLGAKNIVIGNSLFGIEQRGKNSTIFIYQKGNSVVQWEACFEGQYDFLFINEKKISCSVKTENGLAISFVTTDIAPGETIVVSTGN